LDSEKRRTGRPRTREEPRLGNYVGFKSDGVLSQRLKSAAELSEDSLSGETKRRLVLSFDYEDAFEQAMILAFGPDNAHFVYLLAVVVNAFAPQGQWRDDPTIGRSIARGYARLFERLGAPGNGALIDDIKNPEDRVVDKLLDELGHVSRYGMPPLRSPGAATRTCTSREHAC